MIWINLPRWYRLVFGLGYIATTLAITFTIKTNTTLAAIIAVTFAAFALATLHKYKPKEDKKPIHIFNILTIVGGNFLATVFATAALNAMGLLTKTQANQDTLLDFLKTSPQAAAVVTVLVLIIAPISEEIIFRDIPIGFTHEEFMDKKTLKNLAPWIIYAIIFTAMHAPSGISGWVTYGILAATLTITRLRYRDVAASMMVHTSWNLFALIMMFQAIN